MQKSRLLGSDRTLASRVCSYLFYKSMCYACTQFWFNVLCAWTMQPMYTQLHAPQHVSQTIHLIPPIQVRPIRPNAVQRGVLCRAHHRLRCHRARHQRSTAAHSPASVGCSCDYAMEKCNTWCSYAQGQHNTLFTIQSFVSWVTSALMQSAACAWWRW